MSISPKLKYIARGFDLTRAEYFSYIELDQYPLKLTVKEATARYAQEKYK